MAYLVSFVLKKKRTKRHKIGYIPQEIVIKILLLLPLESILSCKRVSKQWRNLINDPDFHKQYLPRSSLSFLYYESGLYCILTRPYIPNMPGARKGRCHPPFTMHRLPIDLGGRKLKVTPKRSSSPWKNEFEIYLGSSNGVVCVLLNDGSFSFYNLFTGDSRRVVDAPPRHSNSWLRFGFGYDRYGDDYKIMVVCKYAAKDNYGRKIGVDGMVQNEKNSLYWVYSFRESVWEPLEGFPYAAYHWLGDKPQALSFNGFFHWVAKGPGMESKQLAIVTYDLYRCKFGEMLLSSDVNFSLGACVVAELDGQLCCWISDPKKGMYELLVMKEYGVEESWTALIRVSSETTAFSRERNFFHTPMVLYECRDGEKGVLFVNHCKGLLYWYNIDNGERRAIYERDWPMRMMKQPTIINE